MTSTRKQVRIPDLLTIFAFPPGGMKHMLKAILLPLLLAAALPLFGQATKVNPPAAAQTHLKQHYPKAEVKEWKQGAKNFRAEFKLRGETYKATYTVEGAWVRTEHDIKKDELPGAVMRAIKAGKYAAWKLDDAEEHATPEHAQLFKLKMQSEKENAELFFLPDGKLLKEEVKARKVKEAEK
ncbi:MAG TPA: PepSY-like domain-containing protein [Flavobacteriales bacterium]|nr:PepSY-like domain-containing protein [Flavobacteriales bacterium]